MILQLKKDFIALKADIDILDIDKIENVPTSLNNDLVHDLDAGNLKTVPIEIFPPD